MADLEAVLQNLVTQLGRVKLILPPQEQQIGTKNYRVAFIVDPDGLPIELMQLLDGSAVAF